MLRHYLAHEFGGGILAKRQRDEGPRETKARQKEYLIVVLDRDPFLRLLRHYQLEHLATHVTHARRYCPICFTSLHMDLLGFLFAFSGGEWLIFLFLLWLFGIRVILDSLPPSSLGQYVNITKMRTEFV
jgi:hypothetical protein